MELVEAHGTGTKAGDAAEFAGLKLAFGGARPDNQWCALGTVKSQIGHTKAAAGAAGLFKAVMALHHKVLPPTIKVDRPNPKLEIEKSPFYLNTQRRPWIRDGAAPAPRVGVELRLRRQQLPRRARGVRARQRERQAGLAPAHRAHRAGAAQRRDARGAGDEVPALAGSKKELSAPRA